jgi:putative DNA primase/helicase
LLIVDPIIAVTRGKNNDAASDVRDALQSLTDFAREFDCAVIGITHRRKSSNGRRDINPLDSVLGSGAYSQVARGVLGTVRDMTGQCTLFRMKSSIRKEGDGFHYEIQSVPLPHEDETSRIQWGEPVSGTASEIVHTAESDGTDDDKHGNKLNAAMQLLRTELGNGPRSQSEMETLCKTHGFSRSTMMRAKAEVGVKSRKVAGTMIGGWEWYLPIQPDFSALLSSVASTQ